MTSGDPHQSITVIALPESIFWSGDGLQGLLRHPSTSQRNKETQTKMCYERILHALDVIFSNRVDKAHCLGIGPEQCSHLYRRRRGLTWYIDVR